MTEPQTKKSDLGVRVVSAVVMIAVGAAALWFGGWWWRVFVICISGGVFWEWMRLARRIAKRATVLIVWMLVGGAYISTSAVYLALLGGNLSTSDHWSRFILLGILALVIGTDIGAYFVGRTLGGPKIAPSISPSKTWSGLIGGIIGASALFWILCYATAAGKWLNLPGFAVAGLFSNGREAIAPSLVVGLVAAVLAQTGDFFESWMKRKAGVKDSSHLLPGHGGLFDRTDGLLAVTFAYALTGFIPSAWVG